MVNGERASTSTSINLEELRRLLRERCMTAEQLRRALSLSPTTLAKLLRGDPVSDAVFRRIVLDLQDRPVVPIAQQLVGRGEYPNALAREGAA
jgi:transcriptional regulator with XRE-family HTH domain